MSLVPTYVYATDGLFYKNPVIKDDGYFICFDDDDPPELVMMESIAGTSQENVITKANEILQKENLRGIINAKHLMRSNRCFGKRNKFEPAVTVFFQLISPIPPPKGMTGVKIPKSECTVEGISVSEYTKLKGGRHG